MPSRPLDLFCSYSHVDEAFRLELEKHLSMLRRQGLVNDWHFRKISPGGEWEREIHDRLRVARIILFLVSADFLNSDYCYDIEVKEAMRLHKAGKARVIPVILREVDLAGADFMALQALPTDGKPISSWRNRDKAFADISRGIRQVCEELGGSPRGRSNNASVGRDDGRGVSTVFCARCGVRAGRRSECTAFGGGHSFKTYDGIAFCGVCGVKAGSQTECLAFGGAHSFMAYDHAVICKHCGQHTGLQTECTAWLSHHSFPRGKAGRS